jgi:filamentous hemagglutinin family protein
MAKKQFNLGKVSLLSSTALTRQAATLGALSMMLGATSAHALDANALPQGGTVVGGAATITTAPATLTVNQSTNRTVIDWRSFDIGSNATANFVQPGASSIAVNRVNSATNPSEIQGSLNANGQVWILNPNGVMFGKNARVDVAGIVASTGNINKDAFMRGDNRLQFTGGDSGEISNAGMISVADGGLAAFVAPSVRNSGVIQARVGKVTLAAGTTFTLDLAGDDLIELGLGADNALVDQSGELLAAGSIVNISAKAASDVVDSVVNISGTVLASGVTEKGGQIVLTAGNITTTADATLAADGGTNGNGGSIYAYADKTGTYDGSFSAKGGSASGDGGTVETSGKDVKVASGISVNASAANGATGTWTIDPDDLVVGAGGTTDGATVSSQLATINVDLAARNSITVNDDITSAGTGNLSLSDEDTNNDLTVNLNAKIALSGTGKLSGQGTSVNVGSAGSIQNGVDVASSTHAATVTVADGNFAENVTIAKSNLNLLSKNGRDATTITGQGTSTAGTVLVASGANNFTLGNIGHGFTVIGTDNASPAVESAAVYFTGANTGSKVQGNRITANGDAGLQGEYNAANVDLTIDSNIFDGQTFAGANPAGVGFTGTNGQSDQFGLPNVPRQLVVFGGGKSTTNTQNITFTNNEITGTAGGLNGSAQEQGNTLVTIDAVGATITGNTFAGTTTRYGDALRARGSNTTISGNTFDGTNMGANTALVNLKDGALSGSFADVTANNTWKNGAWVDRVVGGYNYVVRSVQTAIGGAENGDTVNVAEGAYAGNVAIAKNITLAGAGMDDTYLTGGIDLGTVSDLTFRDFTVSGASSNAVVKNGKVTNFTMDGVRIDGENVADQHGFASGKFYGDISITNSRFENIRGWSSFDNSTGSSPTDLTSVNFSHNVLDNTVGHITFRGAPANAPVTISYNTVSNLGDTANLSGGVFKAFGADTVDFTNNNISGIGAIAGKAQNGIEDGAALIVKDVATLNVTDNIFTDNQEAILVDNGKNLPGVTNFAGNTFTNNAYDINFGNGVGAADVNFNAGNTFTSGAQTQQHLILGSSSDVDMTNVQFDGKLGSAMTNAELFTVEDRITHAMDNAAKGLVTVKADNVYVTQASGSVARGVSEAAAGNTVNVDAGNFALGTSQLNINKGLTLAGSGEGVTNISTTSTGYGINVTGNDVTLSDFTFNGNPSGSYGIKVAPTGAATNRLTNFAISNVSVDSSYRTGLDLNGVTGATIDNVNVTGVAWGNGISLTDSANVAVTNSTTSGNAWGGLAIYQANRSYDQKVNNISIDGTNSFGEANPVYMQDESASQDIGTVNIAGFTLAGHNDDPSDKFTFLNNSVTGLADWLQVKGQLAGGYVTGWTGSAADNTFSVGHTTDNTAMSITAAAKAAANGATINVGSGTFGAFGTSFGGASGVTIQTADDAIIDGTGLTGRIVDLRADGTVLTGFTINGDGGGVGVSVSGQGVTVSNNTINGTLTGVQTTTQYAAGNAIISGNTIDTAYGISLQNTGNTVTNNDVTASVEGVGLSQGSNTFTGNTFDLGAAGNALALYGTASADDMTASGNTVSISGGGLQGAVDLMGTGGDLNVLGGTYAEDVVVNGASRNISFTGATINKFTTNVATAIGGTVSAVNGFFLNGLTTLLSNTVLNGAVNAGSVAGAGSTLEVNNGATVLNGNNYTASGLTFNGSSTTLTQATTTFDTSAVGGDITFTGPIFGTTDGAQNVVFNAGPGTGLVNGDITMANAGTNAVWLGNMTATGNNLTGHTVYVGGSYNATLAGNETFLDDTLHTRGNVTSNVGGNATGPIVAGGTVNVTAGGNFDGNVTAPTSTVTAQNVGGKFSGGTANLNATNSVNVTTDLTNLKVNSPSGTVNGTFDTYTGVGGPIVVNGKTQTGSNPTNPNQIVVEGFTLPAGAFVTDTGQIVLPTGMMVGLVSPAAGPGAVGGKPKIVIVHNVQMLGQLLAEGYVAIVVDLNKEGDDEEIVALN